MTAATVVNRIAANGQQTTSPLLAVAGAEFGRAADAYRRGDVTLAAAHARSAGAHLIEARRQLADDIARVTTDAAARHSTIVTREVHGPAAPVRCYDRYFGLTRLDEATPRDAALGLSRALEDLAFDLPHLPLVVDDLRALAWQAARHLQSGADRGPTVDAPIVAGRGGLDPLRRWKVGHALYGSANRMAAAELADAVDDMVTGDLGAAASAIARAAAHVTCLTAAMEMAAGMSREQYCALVRPTMRPPAIEVDLTGGMNLDHASYRRAMARLLETCPDGFPALARRHLPLAEARDALLHDDLVDLERHVCLTYRLVGHLPALDEDPSGSAVQALRARLLRRHAAYAPLLRHGRITSAASPVRRTS